MFVALHLLDGPTVLALSRLPENDTPEVRAVNRALDCVLDVDMHVAVETSWGRVLFRLREDDDSWLGLYPCVSIHRYVQRALPVLCCTMGPIARLSIWNCIQMLHPDAWKPGGTCRGSPSVLSVAVVVEHSHTVWTRPK